VTEVTPHFKDGPRHVATSEEWEQIFDQKNGFCRVCSWEGAIEMHHLVGRDLGGDDVPENIVALDNLCHKLVEERKQPECGRLRAKLSAEEIAYVLGKKGQGFLDRYYPALSEGDKQDVGEAEADIAAEANREASVTPSDNAGLEGEPQAGSLGGEIPPSPSKCPTCKRRLPKPKDKLEAPRPKKTISFAVPVDERENGAEIVRTLLDQAKEQLGREDQPDYFSLVEVLVFFTQAQKEQAA
jgi:hypothetical protein